MDSFPHAGNATTMPLAQSKLTAQGQISVPSEIRRKLGIGPGSVLEWHEAYGQIIVRKAGQHTLADVRAALFPGAAPGQETPAHMKDGIKKFILRKHARG